MSNGVRNEVQHGDELCQKQQFLVHLRAAAATGVAFHWLVVTW